jgi:cobalt-zinc-cadmium resistance protein CzcA
VSRIEAQEGPREIQRENGWRRLILGMNIKNIDIGSYVANLQRAIDEQADIPPGYFRNTEAPLKISAGPWIICCWLCRCRYHHYWIVVSELREYALCHDHSNEPAVRVIRRRVPALDARMYTFCFCQHRICGFIRSGGLNGIVLLDHIHELRKESSGSLKKLVMKDRPTGYVRC